MCQTMFQPPFYKSFQQHYKKQRLGFFCLFFLLGPPLNVAGIVQLTGDQLRMQSSYHMIKKKKKLQAAIKLGLKMYTDFIH